MAMKLIVNCQVIAGTEIGQDFAASCRRRVPQWDAAARLTLAASPGGALPRPDARSCNARVRNVTRGGANASHQACCYQPATGKLNRRQVNSSADSQRPCPTDAQRLCPLASAAGCGISQLVLPAPPAFPRLAASAAAALARPSLWPPAAAVHGGDAAGRGRAGVDLHRVRRALRARSRHVRLARACLAAIRPPPHPLPLLTHRPRPCPRVPRALLPACSSPSSPPAW